MELKDSIGVVRYTGVLVEEGILDAGSAAKALHGLESALRYFIAQEDSDLGKIELPIPVKIQQGSWEALIPSTIGQWIIAAAGVVATAYLTTAATKLAEKDFTGKGLADVVREALKGMQWLLKLGKHLGHCNVRNITSGLLWDQSGMAGIQNEKGEYLYVPQEQIKKLAACPPNILSGMAEVIEHERALTVGVRTEDHIEEVTVTVFEKYAFCEKDVAEDEFLFPELEHGMPVELNGIVTRGNDMANTIGFLYDQHILTCYPSSGSIRRFKKQLFLPCRIKGVISRVNKDGHPVERRPKIVFTDLELLAGEGDLFSGELLSDEES